VTDQHTDHTERPKHVSEHDTTNLYLVSSDYTILSRHYRCHPV